MLIILQCRTANLKVTLMANEPTAVDIREFLSPWQGHMKYYNECDACERTALILITVMLCVITIKVATILDPLLVLMHI